MERRRDRRPIVVPLEELSVVQDFKGKRKGADAPVVTELERVVPAELARVADEARVRVHVDAHGKRVGVAHHDRTIGVAIQGRGSRISEAAAVRDERGGQESEACNQAQRAQIRLRLRRFEQRRAVEIDRKEALPVEIVAVAEFAGAMAQSGPQPLALAHDDGRLALERKPGDGNEMCRPNRSRGVAHPLEQPHDIILIPASSKLRQ